MAKIIKTSNFGFEGTGFGEKEASLKYLSRDKARRIADILNEGGGRSCIYYAVVENDYELKVFEP